MGVGGEGRRGVKLGERQGWAVESEVAIRVPCVGDNELDFSFGGLFTATPPLRPLFSLPALAESASCTCMSCCGV